MNNRITAWMMALAIVTQANAAVVVWNGSSGTGTNWSTGANWNGGNTPGSGDDVKFFDAGTNAPAGVPNNLVDATFGGTVASLQFANSNNFHTAFIDDGVTLNLTGSGGLIAGTLTDNGNATIVNATIKGPNGALVINNTAAIVAANQGRSANGNATQRGILDLSGLGTFTATINRIAVGTTTFGGSALAQNATGTLRLGQTNTITTSFVGSPITANFATPTNSIEVGSDNGNAGGVNFLYLGQTNAIFTDSIGVGLCKSTASLLFNTNLNNPFAYVRGASGANSRVRFWTVGDMSSSGSSSAIANGTNDFTAGTVDILVDTLSLGRDRQGGNTGTGITRGTFSFSAGTVDANTIYVGNQQYTAAANVNPMAGVMNLTTPNAVLKVNSVLYLGRTSASTIAASNTSGVLNISGATVYANNILVGTNRVGQSTTNTINLIGGSLIVTNTLATNATGLAILNVSNSTIGLTVSASGSLKGLVQNLTTIGETNLIQLDPAPVLFSSYPQQIALIKYSVWNGSNTFGLASVPAWAPGATIVSNAANQSIDLLLPYDPRPVILSQPGSYSGSPGDNVPFTAGISPNSATPISYQWYLGATPLADGPTGNGSTLSGSLTASLTINNAQTGDNGSYTLVASNAYGSTTSAPPSVLTISAGCVAPNLTGPNNTTVIQGNNATLSAGVSGNPLPALQWQRNGVDLVGETANAYTLLNAQYLTDDGAVFSLIASNSCGVVTNFATLTVIVTPTISAQPVDVVVTNTQAASFSVTATGVPVPYYQWYFNNSPITDATNAAYNIASAAPANIGTYKVVVTNAAGFVTSSNATLTVNSLMSVVAFSPNNGAAGICYDTPLAITFSSAPTLRSAGKIKIFNASNPSVPVDTIDAALGSAQQRNFPGDGQSFTYNTIVINGSTATIYPHFNVLSSNQTYYVTVDNGTFADAAGAYFAGISSSSTWQFTTKVGGPVDPSNPVVKGDGTADFLTVQGAINSIPSGNTTPRQVNIRDGIYTELVNISGKNKITLRGQSRGGTVLAYANNATFQAANSGTTHARMSFKVNANDIVLDTLTVSNSTPQGGSQAEALMIESNARRCIVVNADIVSRQDTILANQNSSQAYFLNSTVKGNFDYIWGGGNLYFDQCLLQTISGTGSGNLTAARTDTGALSTNTPWVNPNGTTYSANGFSFVNCLLRGDAGVSGVTLAGANGTAGGLASFAFCSIDTAVYTGVSGTLSNSYVFWQHNNTDTLNNPVTMAGFQVVPGGDPRIQAATNPVVWFYGWSPATMPVVVSDPTNLTVNANSPASFSVSATATVGVISYQWLKNGTNLVGETGSTLTIPNANGFDAGAYSVVVTTTAGSVTSAVATLTVIPPTDSPSLSGATVLNNGTVQFTIGGVAGSAGFGYRVWASSDLSLSPVTSTWTLLTNDVFGLAPAVYTDADAPNWPQRFYIITSP
ncbi:MAG: pectinesterase family protein [Verrucomicrobiota bacterium]